MSDSTSSNGQVQRPSGPSQAASSSNLNQQRPLAPSTSSGHAAPVPPPPNAAGDAAPKPSALKQSLALTHPDLPISTTTVINRNLNNLQIDRTYHPYGYGMSESLKRARAPFFLPNALLGTAIFAFSIGVYYYSISAVKQDDFSDIDDLLPPLEVRQQMTSIEDELRGRSPLSEHTGPGIPQDVSSGSSIAKALPQPFSATGPNRIPAAWASKFFPGRNVDTMSGIPVPLAGTDVDIIGLMRQPVQIRGPRLV